MRLRWRTYYHADDAIGDAAEATAEGGGVVALAPDPVAEANEHGETPPALAPPAPALEGAMLELFERQQARIDKLESDLAAVLERESRYSRSDHAHPHDASVQVLIDALGEMDREEQAPERSRWWQRKLGGRR